jgi:HAD superfamily hydrolase (TIGR01484 family)
LTYFRALAVDYDGTLALHGAVDESTIAALRRLREAGRRIILVTGREMTELRHVMPELTLFDLIVAENGGVLHNPATGQERALAGAPPPALVQKLMERNVEPLSLGQTILATWQPHEPSVLAAIAELGLDHQIIFNKGAVMVLPAGVNKGTGLAAALHDLELSASNVVGAGDAENDLAFLSACGCSAAVANALTSVKEGCDLVLTKDHGEGIVELIDRMLREDAMLVAPSRRGIPLSAGIIGTPIWLTPQDSLLIVGGSGSGKSRFVTLLVERMVDRGFGVCVLDPEGEYENLQGTVATGDELQAGSIVEAVRLIGCGMNVVFGTVTISLDARRRLFERLVPRVFALRRARGRPHWLVVDEAHHYLPNSCTTMGRVLTKEPEGLVLATIDPTWLPAKVIAAMDYIVAFGSTAAELLSKCPGTALHSPSSVQSLGPDQALLWSRASPGEVRVIPIDAPRHRHERHHGKYAVGNVGAEHSFYFGWSSDGSVHRAQNLAEFIAEADLLPDEVWLRHLRGGDIAAWFLHVIRDEELSRRAREISKDSHLNGFESRQKIAEAIGERYAVSSGASATE